MTFDETLYGRDDEMDDYGDGSYGDSAEDEAYKTVAERYEKNNRVTAMDVAGKLGFSQLNIATVHEEKSP